MTTDPLTIDALERRESHDAALIDYLRGAARP
jgi:hypothetical protein